MSKEKKTVVELDKKPLEDFAAPDAQPTKSGHEWESGMTDPTLEMSDVEAAIEMNTQIRVNSGQLQDKIRQKMKDSSPRIKVDPLIGQVFGDRFEIQSKIGAGGMGIVYKARQRGMDRDVAIKVLLKEYLTNETAIRRFQREALAVSKLEHPNTVRIYDFGESNEGLLYIAMEFLGGAPLDKILAVEGQLPVRRVLRIIQQVCRSLNEAKSKGIVHRDLKPDNIFVGNVEGQRDFTKVLDFGLAKLRASGDEQGTLTQHGTVFGTPKYMSPEQCRSQDVDHRTDLYSLGIIMHELLSGRVPFEADNPLAILIMHAQDPVQPMSVIRPNLVIPFEVEELMHRLLAKDAKDRPETAKKVIQECEKLLKSIPMEFEKVLTYEDAEEHGMQILRSQAYTIPEHPTADGFNLVAEPLDDDKTAQPTIAEYNLPPVKARLATRITRALLVFLALVGISGAVIWHNLVGLKEQSNAEFPQQWTSRELPKLTADTVKITVKANIGGVTVVDAKTDKIHGEIKSADAPFVLDVLREPKRKISLKLKHAGSPPVLRTLVLDKDQTVVVDNFTTDDVAKIELSAQANVSDVLVDVEGMEHPYRLKDANTPNAIPITKANKPLKVTFQKDGFKTVERTVVPSQNLNISVNLEAIPEPESKTVTVTLGLNVGKVKVRNEETGQTFETPKSAKESFELALATSNKPVKLTFEKRGFVTQEKVITPDKTQTLAISLAKKRRTTKAGDKNDGQKPKATSPTTPKADSSPGGRLSRIK